MISKSDLIILIILFERRYTSQKEMLSDFLFRSIIGKLQCVRCGSSVITFNEQLLDLVCIIQNASSVMSYTSEI